ncbi:MAG: hypothetical protein M1831_004878 [Alyxoria varia]|nr:MAG: hypothetical protein M1831_004878 [Alyxoria varia]
MTSAATSPPAKAYLSHVERTADSPRDTDLHPVTLQSITQPVPHVRLLRLRIDNAENGIVFQAGQWLDVHIPGIAEAGGFTIVSDPSKAVKSPQPGIQTSSANNYDEDFKPYIELAIQRSPRYAPAAWAWQEGNPSSNILRTTLHVRVGGNFVWPPRNGPTPERAVFVAGGVGINPFMSMLSHMDATNTWPKGGVTLMYGSKTAAHRINQDPSDSTDVLFFSKLWALSNRNPGHMQLKLFLTGTTIRNASDSLHEQSDLIAKRRDTAVRTWNCRMDLSYIRRVLINHDDDKYLDKAVSKNTIVYVCGPQAMTDTFVEEIQRMGVISPVSVLCEKWW